MFWWIDRIRAPRDPSRGPLQAFDLEVEAAARLREENERRERWRNTVTLRKGGGLNVVLPAMQAGDGLEEHSAPGPITLVVREGRIRLTAEGEPAFEAGPETMLACDAGVYHAAEALSDAVWLIRVATSE